MKHILVVLVGIATFFSCAKSDYVDQQTISNQKLSSSNSVSARPLPDQLQKSYNALVVKLTSGDMGFETFYSELQALLAPLKRNKPHKNLPIFSARSGAWNYTPGPCDFENDPVGCSEFWQTECMSYCQDQFYIATDGAAVEEEAAYVDYWLAQQECNNNYPPGTARDNCMAAAATAYSTRMASVMATYIWANNELSLCEASCANW